jgi:hypothetical protein
MKDKTYTERHRNGKGSKPRTNTAKKHYQDNYAEIDWTKKHTTIKK